MKLYRKSYEPKIMIDQRAKRNTGIWRYSKTLQKMLKRNCIPYTDSFTDYSSSKRISAFNALKRFFYELAVLPFLLRKKKIALFHCTKNFGLPLMTFGTRKILTVQDIIPLRLPEYSKKRLDWWFYYINLLVSCFAADRIICISHFTAEELLHFFPCVKRKISIIHLGVDFEGFAKMESVRDQVKGFDLRRKYILTMGGTEPRKNTQIIARVFLQKDFFPNYDLVIIGSEWNGIPYSSDICHCKRIFRLEGLSEEDLHALYQHASVFVFASFYEGFGFPPLEAMACGIPVIAAKTSCLPEILDDAAFWFDPNDIQSLTNALENVLKKETLRCFLKQKGLHQVALYTQDKMIQKTDSLYKELLGES